MAAGLGHAACADGPMYPSARVNKGVLQWGDRHEGSVVDFLPRPLLCLTLPRANFGLELRTNSTHLPHNGSSRCTYPGQTVGT